MKVKPKSAITIIKLYKVAEAHTTTTAKIVLTNAVLLRFVMIVSIIGAFRKTKHDFMQRTMYTSTLKHTSTFKRKPVSCGMLQDSV